MNAAIPFTPLLKHLQELCLPLCNAAGIETSGNFNAAFGNLYKKGHKIGLHSDDNEEIKCSSPIVSFSFGVSTTFEFADKQTQRVLESVNLSSGDVIIMGPGCQEHYLHGAPQRLRPKH